MPIAAAGSQKIPEFGSEATNDLQVLRSQLLALKESLDVSQRAANGFRRQAEEKVWAHSPFLSPFTQNLPCLAFLKNTDGQYVYVNERWEQVFRHRLEDWHGKTDFDLWPRDTALQIGQGDEAVRRNFGPVQTLETLPAHDGNTHWLMTRFLVPTPEGRRLVGGLAVDITERRRAEQALEESERQYRSLFDSVVTGIYRTTREGDILLANQSLARMLGYASAEELMKVNVSAFYSDNQRREFLAEIESAGQIQARDCVWTARDGRQITVRENAKVVRDSASNVLYYEGVVEDITEARRAQLLELERNWVLEMVVRNEPFESILQAITGMLVGQSATDSCAIMVRKGDRLHPAASARVREEWLAVLAPGISIDESSINCGQTASSGESTLTHDIAEDERWEPVRRAALTSGIRSCWSIPIRCAPQGVVATLDLYSHGRIPVQAQPDLAYSAAQLAAVAIEHAQLHNELVCRARTDSLTGLANRVSFEDWLNESLESDPEGQRGLSLFWIDLDRFKVINETLGHRVGDLLLQQVADRMKACLRPDERLARLGGDEFGVLLETGSGRELAEECARRLLSVMDTPFQIEGYELFVTASIGICSYPEHGRNAATLQSHADRAMYKAKAQAAQSFYYFDQELRGGELERLELESGLRHAIENEELVLHYQPQMDLAGNLRGLEALVRWKHPKYGLIGPNHFIALAENTGIIVQLGSWVVEEACRQCAQWARSGAVPVKIAVNVSALQFYFSDFADIVRRALEKTGVDPSLLEIELTESTLMRNAEECLRQMNRVRALGVTIAIDDFGTGYSSLSYLQRLPVDSLKIDRSFLEHAGPPTHAVLRGITDLGHSLGLHVVQEGVESEEQMDILREIQVDLAQGYWLGRPMPAAAVYDLMRV